MEYAHFGKSIRIGYGSAYEGDRIEPGVLLAERGNIQYLCFDTLAERTLAFAHKRKLADPSKGYNELTDSRLRAVLPACIRNNIKIISNMGGANPVGASEVAIGIAKEIGLSGIKIATVLGDDVRDLLTPDLDIWETGEKLEGLKGEIVSANAYLGSDPIVIALEEGADVIITGRVADPSLFLAPLIHEFGWREDDWDKLGAGTVLGHLVECATHVTGGNYLDPGYTEEVPDIPHLGYPIVEASPNGEGIVTKLPDSGGIVTVNTCKSQLLYEIHDPENYMTPDVVANFANVTLKPLGKDQVLVSGGTGKERPSDLKVMIGVMEGYIGEGEIGWAGPGCYEKAKITAEAIKENLRPNMPDIEELRVDFIGIDSIFGPLSGVPPCAPNEVRLRVAGRTKSRQVAERIGLETERMFFGPLGAGGARKYVREVLAMYSTLIPRKKIPIRIITNQIVIREVQ